jgi:hypothetical protein
MKNRKHFWSVLYFLDVQCVGYKPVLCLSIAWKVHNIKFFMSFIKNVPYQKKFEIMVACFIEVHILLLTSIFCDKALKFCVIFM